LTFRYILQIKYKSQKEITNGNTKRKIYKYLTSENANTE